MVDDLKEEVKKVNDSVKNVKTDLTKTITEKLSGISSDLVDIKKSIEDLERKNLELEVENRRKNLIVFNIEERASEDIADIVRECIKNNTSVDVTSSDVDVAYRIGKPVNNKTRPIILKLTTQRLRDSILHKVRSLKNKNVAIYEDQPKKISDFRKKVYPLVKVLRGEGKRVFFSIDKFQVNGVVWTRQQVDEALSMINKRQRSPDNSMTENYTGTTKKKATGDQAASVSFMNK